MVSCDHGLVTRQTHYGKKTWQRKASHFITARKQRENELESKELWTIEGPCSHASIPHSFHLGPPPHFPHSHESHQITNPSVDYSTDEVKALIPNHFPRASPLKNEAMGSILEPNCSTFFNVGRPYPAWSRTQRRVKNCFSLPHCMGAKTSVSF